MARNSNYTSVPPAFVNLDQLPSPWREKNEAVLFRKTAMLPPASMMTCDNALLYGMGNISKDGAFVLGDMSAEPQSDRPEGDAEIPTLDIEAALLRKPGDSNFGHWIVELLPRVREYRAHLDRSIPFLVPQSPFSMQALRLTTLDKLGVSADNIVFVDVRPKQIRRLSFITSNSIHSHTHDCDGVRHVVAQLKQGLAAPEAKRRRLFVARKPGLKRQLLNEAEIVALAEAAGFECIYPEDLSIEDQIALFASAEMVVGVAGAGLTNIAWAPKDCRVLSLHPDTGHEFFFWDLANIIGLEYSMIFGPSTAPTKLVHADFSVNPKLFSKWLKG